MSDEFDQLVETVRVYAEQEEEPGMWSGVLDDLQSTDNNGGAKSFRNISDA